MPEMPIPQDADRHIAGIPAGDDAPPDTDAVRAAGGEVVELPDGSALVMDPSPPEVEKSEFYANLAEDMEEADLSALAQRYLDLIERDKEARKRRMAQYADAVERTGLTGKAPGGATFSGASDVTHPLLVEAVIDFQANAIRELFPPTGPVRAEVKGQATREKVARATRKTQFMNWQLTKQVQGYRNSLEQLLAQLPMGGSQYQKWYFDARTRRPRCEFTRIDDVLLPFAAPDFYSARRVTVQLHLTQDEFEERVEAGMYRDASQGPPALEPEASKVEEAQRKVEGKDATAYNEDGERLDYEIYCYLKLEDDPEAGEGFAPYVMTVSDHDSRVLSIYRNWDQDDPIKEKLDWLVEWSFIPWDGAYAIGLAQALAGIPKAATGALRALLDSAHVNNIPSGIRMKGARSGGQSVVVNPGEIAELESVPGVDDIRKLAMPFPFNQPSPVLFQLLGLLTDYGKGVVSTAEEKIKDATSDMPVGTALALIEQGAKVYSGIHGRMHASQAKSLEVLSRINRTYYDDAELAKMYGEPIVSRRDFAETTDVVPVSDPSVFSEGQRYAQAQAALGMSADPRVPYNVHEVHRFALERMKFPEIDRILPPPPKPMELNSVAENMASVAGKPLAAFPDQNHLAHLEVHLRFCVSPFIVTDPQAVMRVYPAQLEHVRQHVLFFYARMMHDAVSAAAGQDLNAILKDARAYKELDAAFAAASETVDAKMREALEMTGVLPLLQQMFQTMQSLMPPQPQDPAIAAVEAALKETERRAARDKEEMALANKDQQQKAGEAMAELKLDFQKQLDERTKMSEEARREFAEMVAKISNDRESLDLDKKRFAVEAMEKLAGLEAQFSEVREGAFQQRDAAVANQATALADAVSAFGQRLDSLEDAGNIRAQQHSEQLKTMVEAFGTLVKTLGAGREATLSNGRRVRIGPAIGDSPIQ